MPTNLEHRITELRTLQRRADERHDHELAELYETDINQLLDQANTSGVYFVGEDGPEIKLAG